MNNPASTLSRQRGFTLIELIVVIVILGILAAVALPKFADFGNDARIAALKGASGALDATAAMVHGKVLTATTAAAAATVTLEGTNVTVVNGYPSAAIVLATAAGLKPTDWTIIGPSVAATANTPATTATQMAIVPIGLAGNPKGLTCFVRYTQAVNATTAATTALTTTGC